MSLSTCCVQCIIETLTYPVSAVIRGRGTVLWLNIMYMNKFNINIVSFSKDSLMIPYVSKKYYYYGHLWQYLQIIEIHTLTICYLYTYHLNYISFISLVLTCTQACYRTCNPFQDTSVGRNPLLNSPICSFPEYLLPVQYIYWPVCLADTRVVNQHTTIQPLVSRRNDLQQCYYQKYFNYCYRSILINNLTFDFVIFKFRLLLLERDYIEKGVESTYLTVQNIIGTNHRDTTKECH